MLESEEPLRRSRFHPRRLASPSSVRHALLSVQERRRPHESLADHEFGAPTEVLQLDDVDMPEAGPGEVQIAVEAITINFNDIDGIRGRYRTVPVEPPYIPGMEVLGRVQSAGKGGESLIGTRVCAIPTGAFGGYRRSQLRQ